MRSFRPKRGSVTALALRPDGQQLLTGAGRGDGGVTLWAAETGQPLRELAGHGFRDARGELVAGVRSAVGGAALSSDGRWALTGSGDDGSAILWDIEAGRRRFAFSTRHADAVNPAPIDMDPLDRFANGTLLNGGRGFGVAISPDGRRVIVAGKGGGRAPAATIHDATTGRPLRELRGPKVEVSAVAFSRDGKRLLTGGMGEEAAILWDPETGTPIRALRGHQGALNEPGRIYPAASNVARILAAVDAVAFNADGRWALTGANDRTAILWDVATGRALRTFRGHTNELRGVGFLADSRLVVTASLDGTTRLWDVATGDELCRLITLRPGEDWLVCTPEGLFDGSEGGRSKVAYRVGGGLNVVPVDRFFQDFYHPGLLAELVRGERPRPEVEIGRVRPPLIRIVAPKPGAAIELDSVEVEVEVEDQGGGIRGPQLFQNGVRVLAPGDSERRGKVLKRVFQVGLVPGRNQFEVRAGCGDGSQDSDPVQVQVDHEKPLNKGDLYVLSVGINHYAVESMDLQFAAADAKAMAALFRERGASLYRSSHLTELIDGRATRPAIRGALKEIAERARPQDTLVVFLAGHGTMVGQRFYFIPHEYRDDPGASPSEAIQRLGLAADVLADDLSSVKALRRLMVLDACQSGGALTIGRSRDPFAMRGAIERIARSQGLFTIAAAVAGDEAHEIPELGHGALTYALLAGLGAADRGPLSGKSLHPENPERVADVFEWFGYAADQLPRLTKRYLGREQQVVTKIEGVSFPVLPVESR